MTTLDLLGLSLIVALYVGVCSWVWWSAGDDDTDHRERGDDQEGSHR